MPYIKRERRNQLCPTTDWSPETPGELNYVFTLFVKYYIDDKGLSYQTINDVIGALEGAKMEFYRRIAVPYEEQKIAENSDVY